MGLVEFYGVWSCAFLTRYGRDCRRDRPLRMHWELSPEKQAKIPRSAIYVQRPGPSAELAPPGKKCGAQQRGYEDLRPPDLRLLDRLIPTPGQAARRRARHGVAMGDIAAERRPVRRRRFLS